MESRFFQKAWFLMRGFILSLLRLYKRFVSPLLPRACRFEPTCSVYMYQAIQKKGIFLGVYLGTKRLLKCHPFSAGGFDPVP
jgi:uncharacterized protein